MSNCTDLYIRPYEKLALPGQSLVVSIDGRLRDDIQITEIVRSSWPDFSYAKLRYIPNDTVENAKIEQISRNFYSGRSVIINRFFNPNWPANSIDTIPVFAGTIEATELIISERSTSLEITARDFSAQLERITVFGRRVIDNFGEVNFIAGADTIFNERSRTNASISFHGKSNRQYRLFASDELSATHFTYADVIYYLLCEYTDANQLAIPPLDRLVMLSSNRIASDLDLTGMNLLEALHNCALRAGLAFRFEPNLAPDGPDQMILFYRPGQDRTIELSLQSDDKTIDINRTNISYIRSENSYWPVTNRYIFQGQFKFFEATFELVKGWDPTLESDDFDTFSPSSNPQFHLVKDVYRKWVLNESGLYSYPPYNQGPPYDFSDIFGTEAYVMCKRRFWPAITIDEKGQSLGYFLEVSYDNGQSWRQYLYAFDNLMNECGIWLSSDRLDFDTWVAAITGQLKFRITASVMSDERLTYQLTDGPEDSAAPVIDNLVQLPRQFRYRKLSPLSIFYNSDFDTDEIDDSKQLACFARAWMATNNSKIGSIEIHTTRCILDYQPGDRLIPTDRSRRILPEPWQVRKICQAKKIHIDLEHQKTIISADCITRTRYD